MNAIQADEKPQDIEELAQEIQKREDVYIDPEMLKGDDSDSEVIK